MPRRVFDAHHLRATYFFSLYMRPHPPRQHTKARLRKTACAALPRVLNFIGETKASHYHEDGRKKDFSLGNISTLCESDSQK